MDLRKNIFRSKKNGLDTIARDKAIFDQSKVLSSTNLP